jgi:NAD-dependent dihydropyrimidine dehydrogenase PreA subunit
MMAETNPYQVFAEKMFHKDSKWIPEILKSMINDQEAALLVGLPGSAEQMAEKSGRPVKDVAADLEDLFHKGLAFKKEKGGVLNYRGPMHLAQFHDASILWPEAPESFYMLWQKYMDEEWPKLAPLITKLMPRPFTRVIPVGKTLDAGKAQVLAPDDVRKIIEGTSRVAVTKCTCRLTMKRCDAPVEVCLQIGKGADYTVERGSGREITKAEALDIIRQAEDAGLVHVTMNKSDLGHFICNCCGCCCQSFTLLISDSLPLCDPSRFKPKVDAELCSACGDCEERCWFGAIALGDDDVAVADDDLCLGCGQCAFACPEGAITMVEAREASFIPK